MKHEVSIAEMIVLRTIFRETKAARIISTINSVSYSGNLKSLIVMEIAKAKKAMPRLSNLDSQSCIAYLSSPLVSTLPRPDILKKVTPMLSSSSRNNNIRHSLSYYKETRSSHYIDEEEEEEEMSDGHHWQSGSMDSFSDQDDNDNFPAQLLYEKLSIMQALRNLRNNDDEEELWETKKW